MTDHNYHAILLAVGLLMSFGSALSHRSSRHGQTDELRSEPDQRPEERLGQIKDTLDKLTLTMIHVQEEIVKVRHDQAEVLSRLDTVGDNLASCKQSSVKRQARSPRDVTSQEVDQLTRIETSVDLLVNRTIVPHDCADALALGKTQSGLYTVSPDGSSSFRVYCDQRMEGGGWTVVQRRLDGSVNFYQGWATYKQGFGDRFGEFWIGNDRLHRLTWNRNQNLRIRLESKDGNVAYANYARFAVGNERNKYKLLISGYSGGNSPGDALSANNGSSFSTPDKDHDTLASKHCSRWRHGAWWYQSCGRSNLNGQYNTQSPTGLYWYPSGRRLVLMKATTMMIRTAV